MARPVVSSRPRLDWRVLLALVAITLLLYLPTMKHGFLLLDDDYYVWNNGKVLQGLTLDSLQWAFQTYNYFYWQPLTWISHMIDADLYGREAGGHHVSNAILHALNAGLLLIVLWKMTGRLALSAMTAALFAWHPLRIESVAWVAERKDLLSATFWLLAMWAYTNYARTESKKAYWWTVAAMLGGLASKPTVVTLPFALLLLDYWPLERKQSLGALLKEKAPFFLITLVGSWLTYIGQSEMGAVAMPGDIAMSVRLQNALASYAHYLAGTLLPVNLAIFYPYRIPVPMIWVAAGAMLLLGLSALAIWQRRERPYLFVGWFWFAGVLVPTIGIVQAGQQAYADRFTYLPSIGLLVAIVWGGARFFEWREAAVVPLALAAATWFLLPTWKDTETLFKHTMNVTGPNPVIAANLAYEYIAQNRNKEAIALLETAARQSPNYLRVWTNLGTALERDGRIGEASEAFDKALALQPKSGTVLLNAGIMRFHKGKDQEALDFFQRSLQYSLNPVEAARAHVMIGAVYGRQKMPKEAEPHFRAAIEAMPTDVSAHRNLVQSLLDQGRRKEAMRHLSYAVAVTKNDETLQRMQFELNLGR